MEISKDLKVGIIGGVISSLAVLYFIQPILAFLWNTLILVGESLQAGFLDSIYTRAALRSNTLITALTPMFFVGVIFFIVISGLLNEVRRILPNLIEAEKLFVTAKKNNDELEKNPKFQKHFADLKEILKLDRRRKLFTYVCEVVFLFFMAFISLIFIGTEQTIRGFDQKVAILAPSVTDQQIKVWNSQWALMQTAADYRAIEKSLLSKATELKIELPQSKFR